MGTRKKKTASAVEIECIQIDDEDETPSKKVVTCRSKKEQMNCNDVEMDVSFPSDEWFNENWGPADPATSKSISPAVARVQRRRKRKMMKGREIVEDQMGKSSSEAVELGAKRKKRSLIKQEFMENNNRIEENSQSSADVSEGEDLETALPTPKKMKTDKQKATDIRNSASTSMMEGEELIFLFQKTPSKANETHQNNIKLEIGKDVPIKHDLANDSMKYGVEVNANHQIMKKIANYRDKFPKEFSQFNKSIWTHLTKNLQNDHTFTWKMRIRTMLHNQIRKLFPTCSLLAVGSTVNGCGSYNSDMDLCLGISCPAEGFETPRNYAVKHLRKVMKHLLQHLEIGLRVEFIPAKVPILKINFAPPYDQLEVDMNVNNIAGIYNSFLLHNYSRIDDRFSALCLIVKHWAKVKGIGDACAGFLNSYSVILMILHFLQCGVDPPILPNLQRLYPHEFRYNRPFSEIKLFQDLPVPLPNISPNEQTVGELVLAFFEYYNRFDFDRDAISVSRGCIFPRTELPPNTDRFKLFIEEPFDQQNTARCVTNEDQWMVILDAFGKAARELSPSSKHPPNLRRIGIRTL